MNNRLLTIRWIYRHLKEWLNLAEVFDEVIEFFRSIHKIISNFLKVVANFLPPIAMIIASVGYIASLHHVLNREPIDKVHIGSQVVAGFATLTLAILSLVFVQYAVPFMVVAMGVSLALTAFKSVRLHRKVNQLKLKMQQLSNESDIEAVQHDIQRLECELTETSKKRKEKVVALSYSTLIAVLVIIGLALPMTAIPTLAIVTLATVGYTVYSYWDKIKSFAQGVRKVFAGVKLLLKRLQDQPELKLEPELDNAVKIKNQKTADFLKSLEVVEKNGVNPELPLENQQTAVLEPTDHNEKKRKLELIEAAIDDLKREPKKVKVEDSELLAKRARIEAAIEDFKREPRKEGSVKNRRQVIETAIEEFKREPRKTESDDVLKHYDELIRQQEESYNVLDHEHKKEDEDGGESGAMSGEVDVEMRL